MTETKQLIINGKSEEVCAKFKEAKVDCVITDPPFGVDNQSNMAVTNEGKSHATKIANDETPEKAISTYKSVMDALLPWTKPTADAYVFTSHQVLKEWLIMLDEFMPKHGFVRKAVITWDKCDPGMGDLECPWGMGVEFVMYFQKGRPPKRSNRENSVISIPKLRPKDLIHPHEKPTRLLEKFIKTSTEPGSWIVDPFGGSGSLARAARNCDRNAICIELDPDRANAAKKKFAATAGGML